MILALPRLVHVDKVLGGKLLAGMHIAHGGILARMRRTQLRFPLDLLLSFRQQSVKFYALLCLLATLVSICVQHSIHTSLMTNLIHMCCMSVLIFSDCPLFTLGDDPSKMEGIRYLLGAIVMIISHHVRVIMSSM